MSAWDYITLWGWPILWLVAILTFIDALHEHGDLSEQIKATSGKEKNRAIRRRILKWFIFTLAFLGAFIAQKATDISDNKITNLESKIAPRTITPEQEATVIAILKNAPKGPITVISISPNAEANRFAKRIREVLDAAGYGDEVHKTVKNMGNILFDPGSSNDAISIAFREVVPPNYTGDVQRAFISIGYRMLANTDNKNALGLAPNEMAIVVADRSL